MWQVEEDGRFLGLILRSHVVGLLRSKAAFQVTPETPPPPLGQADESEFAKPVSTKGVGMEEVELTAPELAMWLDLGPFLNPSPYVVEEDMSLAKVIPIHIPIPVPVPVPIPVPVPVHGHSDLNLNVNLKLYL